MLKKMRGGRDPAVIARHSQYKPDFGAKTDAELASSLAMEIIEKNDGKTQQRHRDPPEPQNHPFLGPFS
jgi:hypothetical protein